MTQLLQQKPTSTPSKISKSWYLIVLHQNVMPMRFSHWPRYTCMLGQCGNLFCRFQCQKGRVYLFSNYFAKYATISFHDLNAIEQSLIGILGGCNFCRIDDMRSNKKCQSAIDINLLLSQLRKYEYWPGDIYSFHVTEHINCTFCKIVSTKMFSINLCH